MYLARIYLSPHRRGTEQLIRSQQTLHAAVLSCFPPSVLDNPGTPRVSWRLDRPPTARGAAPHQGSPSCSLYISSPVAPDPSHIVEETGCTAEGGVVIRDMSGFLEGLWAGQRWGFRLYINPTFQESSQVNTRGRKEVLAHVTQNQQARWVLKRAGKCGFRVLASVKLDGELPVLEDSDGQRVDGASLLINGVKRGIAEFKCGERHVTLGVATFEGVFEVTDPNTLCKVLTHEIGRGKAYGYGLVTLARPWDRSPRRSRQSRGIWSVFETG